MNYIPADRIDRLIDKRTGKPRKRIGDYTPLYRHGWARIIIGLPFMALGALVIYGWIKGEPADSWPLLCGGWVVGLVFIADGLRTLGMIPTRDVPPPPVYPESESVRSALKRAGQYRGDVNTLAPGARSPDGTVWSMTAPTGQTNQWGEPVEVTASFNRNGEPIDIQYHLQDIPVLDRGGEPYEDTGYYLGGE